MSATNDGENLILDHFLGTTEFEGTGLQLYIALTTSNPSESNAGTEVSGGGYSRKSVNFDPAFGGIALNSNDPTWTATSPGFGTVVGWNLYDASSGGNRLFYDTLSPSIDVNTGETITLTTIQIVLS